MNIATFWKRHTVYRIFAADGTALYVGSTSNFPARIYSHRRSQPWAADITRVVTTEHPNRVAALGVERDEIKRLNPAHNLVHTPRNPHLKVNKPTPSTTGGGVSGAPSPAAQGGPRCGPLPR